MQSHNFIEFFSALFSICDNDVIATLQDNSRFMTHPKRRKRKKQEKMPNEKSKKKVILNCEKTREKTIPK